MFSRNQCLSFSRKRNFCQIVLWFPLLNNQFHLYWSVSATKVLPRLLLLQKHVVFFLPCSPNEVDVLAGYHWFEFLGRFCQVGCQIYVPVLIICLPIGLLPLRWIVSIGKWIYILYINNRSVLIHRFIHVVVWNIAQRCSSRVIISVYECHIKHVLTTLLMMCSPHWKCPELDLSVCSNVPQSPCDCYIH